ncbi:MAG: DUF805 domain-containing protein [Litorimonas sp.]
MIGFGEAIGLFYKNYVNFEGRASRAEYWWPTLMQIIVYVALFIAFALVVGFDEYEASGGNEAAALALMGAGFLFALVNLLPGIAVKVRRFHDLDQTGWLVLVFWGANIFIPLVEFARMIWFAFPGTDGPNQYGPDPYGYDADIFG